VARSVICHILIVVYAPNPTQLANYLLMISLAMISYLILVKPVNSILRFAEVLFYEFIYFLSLIVSDITFNCDEMFTLCTDTSSLIMQTMCYVMIGFVIIFSIYEATMRRNSKL
jgi:hypothetical protein